jgi:hypothetical protein
VIFTGPLASIAAAMTGRDGFEDAEDGLATIAAEVQERYRAKLRKWEASAPQRQAAQAAFEAAHRRRAAEAGASDSRPVTIAAALDWMRPQPPGGS